MLRWRLIFAAAILVPLLALLVVDYHWSGSAPGIWLFPVGLLITLLATGEVLDLIPRNALRPAPGGVFTGVLLVFASSCAPLAWPLMGATYPVDCPLGKLGWPLSAMAASVIIVLIGEMRRFENPGRHVVRVALAVFVICYVGLLMSFTVQLRMYHDNRWGMAALVSLIFVVKIADTGAYAVGKLWGRHKMSPRLSPGKTIEGAVGGILAGAFAAWVYFELILPWIVPGAGQTALWRVLLFGVLLAAAGMVGDLAESLIKRDFDRKDSSGWLPGLGGVLDVLDSIIVAAPVAFLCWAAGLIGPQV